MDYSILYKNTELKTSSPIAIYQNENNGNVFRFYLDMESLDEFTPTGIQAVFCYKYPGDNTFNETVIPLEAEMYKDRYMRGSIPINGIYTKLEGNLEVYLKFLEVDMFDNSHELPTNTINIRIARSNYQAKSSGATGEDIERLQKQITDLMNAKAGEFEIEGNKILVYSDSTKTNLIDTLDIPEEVSYEFGEGRNG